MCENLRKVIIYSNILELMNSAKTERKMFPTEPVVNILMLHGDLVHEIRNYIFNYWLELKF